MFPGVRPEAWLGCFAHHLGGLYAGSMVSTLFWLPNPCFCSRLFKRGSQVFCLFRLEKEMATLQYSCLENPMDGGAWQATALGVSGSRTRLSDFTFTFHFHALEKEMSTHSSILAWRIPGMEEPGGVLSMGSQRVGHDCSDLAAVAVSLEFRFCPSCLCTQLFLVPYSFFVFCC